MKQTCILVLGMHRSGTSALTGMLNLLDISLGENLLKANIDNKKGFFENSDLVNINNDLLTQVESKWDDVFFKKESLKKIKNKNKLKQFIKQAFKNDEIFAIKDPRLGYLFPIYEEVLKSLGIDIKIIIPYRNPLDVAKSLNKRNNFSIEKGLFLWGYHLISSEIFTRNYPRVFINFNELLENSKSIVKFIEKKLNLNLQNSYIQNKKLIDDFLDPKLKHHNTLKITEKNVPQILFNIWKLKQKFNSRNIISEFDDIGDEFFSYHDFFYNKDIVKSFKNSREKLKQEHNLNEERFYDLQETQKLLKEAQLSLQEKNETIQTTNKLSGERLIEIEKLQINSKENNEVIKTGNKLSKEQFIEIEKLQVNLKEKDETIQTTNKLSGERLIEIEKLQIDSKEKDETIQTTNKLSGERLIEIEKLQVNLKEKDERIGLLNRSWNRKLQDSLGNRSQKIRTFISLKDSYGLQHAIRESLIFTLNPFHKNIQKIILKWCKKDIMFISGCPGGSMQYRCYIEADYYKKEGLTSEVFLQDNINTYYLLDNFKILIFHRVIWTEHLQNVLNKAKELEIEVIFSTDDLVYDPKYLKDMHYYEKMGEEEKSWYKNGISRELLEDDYVKKCIVTTKFLKKDLEKKGKIVEIRKNKLSFETFKQSKKAIKWWQVEESKIKPKNEFWIGYFSGSASHDKDFKVVENVLYNFLKKNKNVVFFIGGYLTLGGKFESLVETNQIRFIPFVTWEKLPYEIVKMNLNIAPLEIDNPFCQAKSDIKYLEAKAVNIPTIASATQSFVGSIVEEDKNKWGEVAYNERDWVNGFKKYAKAWNNHIKD